MDIVTIGQGDRRYTLSSEYILSDGIPTNHSPINYLWPIKYLCDDIITSNR